MQTLISAEHTVRCVTTHTEALHLTGAPLRHPQRYRRIDKRFKTHGYRGIIELGEPHDETLALPTVTGYSYRHQPFRHSQVLTSDEWPAHFMDTQEIVHEHAVVPMATPISFIAKRIDVERLVTALNDMMAEEDETHDAHDDDGIDGVRIHDHGEYITRPRHNGRRSMEEQAINKLITAGIALEEEDNRLIWIAKAPEQPPERTTVNTLIKAGTPIKLPGKTKRAYPALQITGDTQLRMYGRWAYDAHEDYGAGAYLGVEARADAQDCWWITFIECPYPASIAPDGLDMSEYMQAVLETKDITYGPPVGNPTLHTDPEEIEPGETLRQARERIFNERQDNLA